MGHLRFCPPLSSGGDPLGGRVYVATLLTCGLLLVLSLAQKQRGSPRRQGLCSHLAHLWATFDFVPRSLLFSLGQSRVLLIVAVVLAAAPPPMPPLVRVHPLAVVPREALVTMCHRNPCLMGRHPAGSQDRKLPCQRSVLAPRVPARGHATSGRMIPMLEAPPLPSLLYIYVCGL